MHLPFTALLLVACSAPSDPASGDAVAADSAGDTDVDIGPPEEAVADCDAPLNERLPATAEERDAAAGVNALAIPLLRARPEANPLVAPLTTAASLGELLGGAGGTTAEALRTALGATGEDLALHAGLAGLAAGIGGVAGGASADCPTWNLRGSAAPFVDESLALEDAWVALLADPYAAEPHVVDFGDSAAAGRDIDRWVEESTAERTRSIDGSDQLDADVLLALAAVADFEGYFEVPFDHGWTRPGMFTRADGSAYEVDFMRAIADFGRLDLSGGQAVEVAYRGGDLDLVLVIPTEADGLDALLGTLAPSTLAHEAFALGGDLLLEVPRFEAQASGSLRATFEALGVADAFEAATADLSGVAAPPDGAPGLALGDVLYAAALRVDEAGSGVAAGGAAEPPDTGAPGLVELAVDRPFAYFLRDRVTGAILLAGRMDAPDEHEAI